MSQSLDAVYSAASPLSSPRRFLRNVRTEIRLLPSVAWCLFLSRLQSGYRQSWLGYLWLVLPTLATTLTWVFLSNAKVFDFGATGTPYLLYVLSGTLLWQTFAEALNSPLQQISSTRNVVTTSRVPHEALMLAGLLEVLFNFSVRFALFLPLLLWFRLDWNWSLLLVPLGVVFLMALGFALGLLLTPVGLLYQDVSRGLALIVNFWFFLTPVIYPIPQSWPASLLATLNPVTPLLVTTRNWLTAQAVVPTNGFATVVGLSVCCLVVGWLNYRLARPHLIARL